MILRRIVLKHFGNFRDQTVTFRRGHNVVYGPSGCGKTTLLEAFCAAIFGIEDDAVRATWVVNGNSAVGVELQTDRAGYLFERDLNSDRTVVTELSGERRREIFSGRPFGDRPESEEYRQLLVELFGLADENLFRSSFLFSQRQNDPPVISQFAQKVTPLLQEYGEELYGRVLDDIAEELREIEGEGGDGEPGELSSLQQRLEELETLWGERMASLASLDHIREEMVSHRARLGVLAAQRTEGELFIDRLKHFHSHRRDRQEVAGRLDSLIARREELIACRDRREEIQGALHRLGLGQNLDDRCLMLLHESEVKRTRILRLQEEGVALRVRLKALAPPPAGKTIVASTAICAAGSLIGMFMPAVGTAGYLAGGLGALATWIPYVRCSLGNRGKTLNLQGQSKKIEDDRLELQGALELLDQKLEELGVPIGIDESRDLRARLEEQRNLTQELARVGTALARLPGLETLDAEIAATREELADSTIPQSFISLAESMSMEEVEGRFAELCREFNDLTHEIAELHHQEMKLVADLGDLADIEREGEQLRARERECAGRCAVLRKAAGMLREEIALFRQGYLDRFLRELEEILEKISGSGHAPLRLDKDFHLSLMGEDERWQPLETMSRGTYDLVNLAMRITLSRRMYRKVLPPLLLDEPLVTLAKEHRSAALKALGGVTADQQVVLFTHEEQLLRTAVREKWNLIQLSTKAPVKEPVEERNDEHGRQLHLL